MPRRIRLEPHLTDNELHERYRRARDPVELQHHPDVIRWTTRFHWWPRRIKKRQGPRLSLYESALTRHSAACCCKSAQQVDESK